MKQQGLKTNSEEEGVILSTRLVALVLAATATAMTGCGESSKSGALTKAQLIAKADPICARLHVELHAHGTSNPKEFASNVSLLASFEQTANDELRKLNPPASLAGDWKRMLTGMQTVTGDSVRLGQYAKEGKFQAGLPLLAAGQRTLQSVLTIARRDGFKNCAQPS